MSHKLPSISWRPRKMCIIQSESKGLKTRGVNDVNPSLRAREDEINCPWSNSDTQKKGWIPPFSIFFLFHPSVDQEGQTPLLMPQIQMLIPCRNALTDTPSIMLNLGTS